MGESSFVLPVVEPIVDLVSHKLVEAGVFLIAACGVERDGAIELQAGDVLDEVLEALEDTLEAV